MVQRDVASGGSARACRRSAGDPAPRGSCGPSASPARIEQGGEALHGLVQQSAPPRPCPSGGPVRHRGRPGTSSRSTAAPAARLRARAIARADRPKEPRVRGRVRELRSSVPSSAHASSAAAVFPMTPGTAWADPRPACPGARASAHAWAWAAHRLAAAPGASAFRSPGQPAPTRRPRPRPRHQRQVSRQSRPDHVLDPRWPAAASSARITRIMTAPRPASFPALVPLPPPHRAVHAAPAPLAIPPPASGPASASSGPSVA